MRSKRDLHWSAATDKLPLFFPKTATSATMKIKANAAGLQRKFCNILTQRLHGWVQKRKEVWVHTYLQQFGMGPK